MNKKSHVFIKLLEITHDSTCETIVSSIYQYPILIGCTKYASQSGRWCGFLCQFLVKRSEWVILGQHEWRISWPEFFSSGLAQKKFQLEPDLKNQADMWVNFMSISLWQIVLNTLKNTRSAWKVTGFAFRFDINHQSRFRSKLGGDAGNDWKATFSRAQIKSLRTNLNAH